MEGGLRVEGGKTISAPKQRRSPNCRMGDAGERLGVYEIRAKETAGFATYTHTSGRKLIRRLRTSRPIKVSGQTRSRK